MPKIEFRGKTYDNEFEMPPEERQAYNLEKARRAENRKTGTKPLTEIVEMSPEVKAIYERALGKVEEKLRSSQPVKDLPKTEDIYRQSAPDDLKHLPSDESIYRPARRLIDPARSAIEPEPAWGMGRLMTSLLWALLLAAAVFVIMRFLL